MATTKRLNKTLVIVLTALGFVITTTGGIILISFLQETNPDRFVELAEQATAESDWLSARQYYARAYELSQDPKYLVLVGDTYLQTGDEGRARAAWNQAVVINPQLKDAYEKQIDLQLAYSRFTNAPGFWLNLKTTAEGLLSVESEEPKGLYALGASLIELETLGQDEGDEEEGVAKLEQAVDLAPSNVDYATRLAGYHLAKSQASSGKDAEAAVDTAEAVFKRLVEATPNPGKEAAQSRAAYAAFLLAHRKATEQALKLYDEAARIAGDDATAKAEALADEARYWLGQWSTSRTGSPGSESSENTEAADKVKQLCEQAIHVDPLSFSPYFTLTDFYGAKEQLKEAIQVAEARLEREIVREGSERHLQKFLRYRLLLATATLYVRIAGGQDRGSNEWAESLASALKRVQEAQAELPGRPDALEAEAFVRMAEGKYREALRLCEQADDEYGERISPDNKVRRAQLCLRFNEVGEARKAIEAVCLNPQVSARATPAVWALYAEILLRLDQPQPALLAAEEAVKRGDTRVPVLRLLARTYARLDRPEDAERVYKQIEQAGGKALAAQADDLIAQGRYDEALAIARTELEKDPANERFARAAAQLLARDKQVEEAMKVLQEGLRHNPDSEMLQRTLAAIDPSKSAEQRDDETLAEIQAIESALDREVELGIFHAEKNPAEADRHFKEAQRLLIEAATPEARASAPTLLPRVLRERLQLALDREDVPGAEEIVAVAIERNADSADGLTFLGRVRTWEKKHEEAMQAFKGALDKQPTNSETWLRYGDACLRLNRTSEAVLAFQKATEINPNLGAAWKGLALIASRQGDDEEFARYITRCLDFLPNDPWVKEQSLILREREKPMEGIARREALREQNPDDVQNLFRLAQLYRRAARNAAANEGSAQADPLNAKAEECLQRALSLESTDRALVSATADFYRETGRAEQGLALLQKLVEDTPDPEEKAYAQLMIGEFYLQLGDLAQADSAMLAAADVTASYAVCAILGQHFSQTRRHERALEWYGRAVAAAEKEGSAQVATIRRAEFDCLLAAGQKDQARAKCEEYIQKYPDDPNGLLLQAKTEIASGRNDKAIAALSQYLEQRTDDPEALFQRAQLYDGLGQWQRACADLERVRAVAPDALNFRPRILLARMYDLTNRPMLAETELKSVLDLNPSADTVAVELMRFYEHHGRPADAERLVTARVAATQEDPRWLYHAGRIATEMNDRARAIGLLTKACQKTNFAATPTVQLLDTFIKFKDVQPGIDFYNNALPGQARSALVVAKYARLLAMQGENDLAVKNFCLALDIAGADAAAVVEPVCLDAKRAFGAEQVIDKFRAEQSDQRLNRPSKLMLASLLAGFGHSEEALAVFDSLAQSSESDREHSAMLAQAGNMLEQQDKLEQARERYEEALTLDPNNVVATNNLAYLLAEKLNQPQLALPYARQAVSLQPSPETRDTLGWTYLKLGQFEDAISELLQAVRDTAEYVPGRVHLGEVYRRRGDLAAAQEHLTLALQQIDEDPQGRYVGFRSEAESALNKAKSGQTE